MVLRNGCITDVPGVRVGHAEDAHGLTGCTVVLCERGAVAGCDVRGSAPGTRETDILRPGSRVQEVHAVLLTGGSAFGLDAASGVVRWLEEHGFGYPKGDLHIPIVPAAVLFDLAVGEARRRPDAAMGYAACVAAGGSPVPVGSVGAGLGATVGKGCGMPYAMKGGVGTASRRLPGGATVGVLVAVNAFGDVYDPRGRWLAGAYDRAAGRPLSRRRVAASLYGGPLAPPPRAALLPAPVPPGGPWQTAVGENTTIGVVATDVRLDQAAARKVAEMAQDGVARAVRPAHTLVDGDALFALSTGDRAADANAVGTCAAALVGEAIACAVRAAASVAGIPAWRDRPPGRGAPPAVRAHRGGDGV